MKKRCVVLALTGFIFLFLSPSVYAEARLKEKSIVMTTMDVEGVYEVIGIVSYRLGSTDMNSVIAGLKNEAKKLKADAVVGVQCVSYSDYLYAYGTAVKFEK